MTKEDLIKSLEKIKQAVIAIDGPSSSGKTTLAKELKKQLGATVIHMDDYFLMPSKRTNDIAGNIDFKRLELEVFNNLNNAYLTSNHFNCKTNQLETKKAQKRKNIVIIEGAYSMHPKIVDYYDLKVFIEMDELSQKGRIIQRNGFEKYQEFKNVWIPRENKYFSNLDIKNHADVLIKEN